MATASGVLSIMLALGLVGVAGSATYQHVTEAGDNVLVPESGAAAAVESIPELERFQLAAIARYDAVVARPLFSQTRRPPQPPEPPAPPPRQVRAVPPPPPPRVELGQFRLGGVVMSGTERYALIRHVDDDDFQKVVENQTVMKWRIETIEADTLVMSQHGVRDVLMLQDNVEKPAMSRRDVVRAAGRNAKRTLRNARGGGRAAETARNGDGSPTLVRSLRARAKGRNVRNIRQLGAGAEKPPARTQADTAPPQE